MHIFNLVLKIKIHLLDWLAQKMPCKHRVNKEKGRRNSVVEVR